MTPDRRLADVERDDGAFARHRRRQQRVVAAGAKVRSGHAAASSDVPLGLARREVPEARTDVARSVTAAAATGRR